MRLVGEQEHANMRVRKWREVNKTTGLTGEQTCCPTKPRQELPDRTRHTIRHHSSTAPLDVEPPVSNFAKVQTLQRMWMEVSSWPRGRSY